MDQYLSTYTKDYVWPPVKKNSLSVGKAESFCGGGPCICGAEPGGYMPPREYGAAGQVGDDYQWSRLDPMGPLLDPKLYPAKMGPGRECDATRYDQPDTYMRKLEEKYPYIYNVIRDEPPDDMIRIVNEDRLKTTYQVDYGHIDEHPTADYENLLAKKGLSYGKNVLLDCRAHVRPPNCGDRGEEHNLKNGYGTFGDSGTGSSGFAGDREAAPLGRNGNANGYASGGARNGSDGFGGGREAAPRGRNGNGHIGASGGTGNGPDRPGNGPGGARGAREVATRVAGGSNAAPGRSLAVKAMRSSGESGNKNAGGADSAGGGKTVKRGGNSAEDSEAAKKPLPAWISEYNEVIGQTGFDIVRDRMHQHGGKSPGRVFVERAVLRCRNHT